MNEKRMPVLFIGHGSPLNGIEDNEFSHAWKAIAADIPKPKAILCISAHWETETPRVTVAEHPQTIHDFYGFPQELFDMDYPAPGSPALAERVMELLAARSIKADREWGLDHGTWSVLARMFPEADIPVVQLSLAHTRDGYFHFDLGKSLQPLRDEGILVIGSGNVVHNLRMMQFNGESFDWAVEFDDQVKCCIETFDYPPLLDFQLQGNSALLAVNSAEHYLPLLYTLGLRQQDDKVCYFCEKIVYGSISMRCLRFD